MTDAAPDREAVVDLGAVRRNVETLRATIGTEHTIAVVKANAYGHGAVPVARAALAGGADRLGVADVSEALELREADIAAPLLAWLHGARPDFTRTVEANVELGISTLDQLDAAIDAAKSTGRVAVVHLKLDTGLSRNGLSADAWPTATRAARAAETAGLVRVAGVFSHLSGTSPDADTAQADALDRGLADAARAGLDPEFVHLAASGAALTLPGTRYNTVRLGISIYGLSPFSDREPAEFGLTPAMTLRSRVVATRSIPDGQGVSYGHTYRASGDTNLALVPVGYADGLPRQASGAAEVWIGGARRPVAGRVAMDQIVVDVDGTPASVGDEVVLFGDPATGVPSAEDWARAAGTIGYDIVTRLGSRVRRTYVGE
ncbi:alanine racemase [Humibacter ginsenosidimutans]|uniref:Alanine racemase n=1 Tax=Humibacter ginsenosidimutans TaxID=2599293 RepID=A0A5B8M3K7_9MICO|nr:alanine racemase [Humibacter ginsenosidimutans]QDZ14933.1 alanine racemase [Humibacter ginsenosidimutans]